LFFLSADLIKTLYIAKERKTVKCWHELTEYGDVSILWFVGRAVYCKDHEFETGDPGLMTCRQYYG
jgi:hypothetical protein